MRMGRSTIQALVLCFFFTVPALAQLDSAALRAKFGAPLHREVFRMPAGFDLIVDYGATGQACRLQVPALIPNAEQVVNATVMKQRMYEFLAGLVPDSMRGKELGRMISHMGAATLIFTEYENVTVHELEVGQPFNHDNNISIKFKRDECKDAVDH